jgi:high affinity sulfate transporter 1
VLRHYQRAWLGRDVTAGLVLTALIVPAGMGTAVASGLPAIAGLYATIGPLLAYALFGPSRIMVLGPDSALAPLIAAVVVAKASGDPARAITLAAALAFLAGLLCLVAGLLRAGFVTDLLSKPVRVGYMNGIALTIIVLQLPKLFGFSTNASSFAGGAKTFAYGLAAGQTNGIALAIGSACLVIVLVGRLVKRRAPAVLVAVVLATLVVIAFRLEHRVEVVGAVPRGVPVPSIPTIHLSDALDLIVPALGIALVSFTDTSVLSRTYARRRGYRVEPSRELIALGAANVAAALLRGFPVSSSATRTPVAEAAGSRTQVTGVIAALAIVVLLIGAPWLLEALPTAALAAIVIAAAIHIMDLRALAVFRRVRRADLILSLVAFLAVAAFGVLTGVAVAVGVALLDFVRRAWRPHDAVLGRAPGMKGYHDLVRHPDAKEVPGLLLFRWDAPLFFANADTFRARIIDVVEAAKDPVKWVVVAAEPITDVDSTAAEMLDELDKELASRGVHLAFAEMKDPVRDRLKRYGLEKRIGREFFFPTLGVAVHTFLERFHVEWVDWEEIAKT